MSDETSSRPEPPVVNGCFSNSEFDPPAHTRPASTRDRHRYRQANGGGGGSGFAQGRWIDATVAYTGARRHPGHVGGTGQPAVAVELERQREPLGFVPAKPICLLVRDRLKQAT